MAPKTKAQLVDRTSIILEDSGNTWFTDASIGSQLQACLPEASNAKPWIWRHVLMAVNSSKLGEIQTNQSGNLGREISLADIDIIDINEAEYPYGLYQRRVVRFDPYADRVFLHISARPLAAEQYDAAGDRQVLTGTVTFTSASTAVSGSGTAFLLELEVGSYISPAGSANWYRVASITSDTALVLASNCASGDAGADTAGGTRYWYEYVGLECTKVHYLEDTQTDFAGAIDAGVAGGYAEGTWQINVDALGTGIMAKGMLLTIAGVEGLYIIKEDATITSNEATLKIEPRLKGIAPEDAIVTFLPSSLTPHQEEALCTLAAGRVAMNFVTDARTAQDNAVAAYGLANTEIDKIAAILNTADTNAGSATTAITANFTSATTALGDTNTYLDDANDALDLMEADREIGIGADAATVLAILDEANVQIDLAVSDEAAARADFTGNDAAVDTALTAVSDRIDQAIADWAEERTYADVVPTGLNPAGVNHAAGIGELQSAKAYILEMKALMDEGRGYHSTSAAEIRNARGFIQEVIARMSTQQHLTSLDLKEARERIGLAMGSARQASVYVQADAQQVASYARVISSRIGTANGYLNAGGGYFREAQSSLNAANTIFNTTIKWATLKIADGKAMFRALSPTVRVTRSHA